MQHVDSHRLTICDSSIDKVKWKLDILLLCTSSSLTCSCLSRPHPSKINTLFFRGIGRGFCSLMMATNSCPVVGVPWMDILMSGFLTLKSSWAKYSNSVSTTVTKQAMLNAALKKINKLMIITKWFWYSNTELACQIYHFLKLIIVYYCELLNISLPVCSNV